MFSKMIKSSICSVTYIILVTFQKPNPIFHIYHLKIALYFSDWPLMSLPVKGLTVTVSLQEAKSKSVIFMQPSSLNHKSVQVSSFYFRDLFYQDFIPLKCWTYMLLLI